jgi:protocatechuate 3,4-dioxygenase beta subunit
VRTASLPPLDPEELAVTPPSRRQVLTIVPGALAALVVAACGQGPAGTRSAPAPAAAPAASSTTVATAPATSAYDAGALAPRFGAVNGCVRSPATIAGPSYLQVDALRSDVRDDRPGAPLHLGLRVLDQACVPIAGAAVELWNCDAIGLYSGYAQHDGDTTGLRFCRGTQVTDANGIVAFTTLYPGWYRTRTPHLHTKVLLSKSELLTTQLFFDDAVSATVFAQPPYRDHVGRDTFNPTDTMFRPDTVLTLSPADDGYLGLLDLTVRRA